VSAAIALLETEPQSFYSDAEKLGAEITELCSYIYAAESRFLALIREFDEKGYWAQQGLFSCAHWLKLRVAHALAGLPKISERFDKGQLSFSKVRAITRIADKSNEDYLLMIADHGTAHHVEKLVSKYRTAKRLQDVDIVRAQYNNREVTHYYDDAGCLVIKARLPAEQGALIVKALEMAMDAQFQDKDVYPKGTSTAVHVPLGQTSHIEDGPGVTAVTSRRIACDSSVVCIKEDENGEPLSIGRRSRLAQYHRPCAVLYGLGTRVVAFQAVPTLGLSMGTTSDTGRMVVRRVWITSCCSAGTIITWCMREALLVARMRTMDQREQPLDQSPGLSGVAANDDVQQWIDREFFEADIDSETCSARWYAGERMDWQVAVSALF